jgi:prepilin-type N-terminal cleavage/methylation domain-containing protein
VNNSSKRAAGFSLIELLVVSVIFTIITGAVFSLLLNSQIRYQSESSLTEAFQHANVAMDQITRDVHSAGYPPASSFAPAVCGANPEKIATPFAWSPNYSATWPCNTPRTPLMQCVVNSGCSVPGPYDLILEADLGDGTVQWIRYSLSGTTLLRGAASKALGSDPASATNGVLIPYLDGVLNETQSKPIFSYKADPSIPATASFGPADIREVYISLIVQASKPDPQTGQFRTISLTGQAIRLNPNQ